MKIDILTLFPEIYPGALGSSIVGRAVRNGLVDIRAVDLRDYAHDRRGTVDDRPYGGGPGMLMNAEILSEAIDDLRGPDTLVILTSPRGKRFEQREAEKLSREKSLLFVCGHYEGVDQRVIDSRIDVEYSIGDFVLTSGNLAAMVMTDAVVRLLPGALGDDESSGEESFSTGLLEYPQYTRPPVFEGVPVPEVLLSGDHQKIARWRQAEAERITRERRPDCWERFLKEKNGG
ncbi:MAG: tRNA (guanosine(37)-N1)-methyltransferase TrmD [Lentisphaeria bacterium]|nr:tRNA (guanosine(37)-N1)-methyltransferase TrmD [Lentisphaeria bacterium]MBQ7394001.1 tRNA (guanosine(37)-N1)-methyltransferase TrmD [Lentisphaeria bacterium]